MDQKDANIQKITVHRRDMAFVSGYVNCTTCACNYDASADHRKPTYCQIYGKHIDPSDTAANTLRAEACDQWIHESLDRSKVVTPAHTYHYDKWGD